MVGWMGVVARRVLLVGAGVVVPNTRAAGPRII